MALCLKPHITVTALIPLIQEYMDRELCVLLTDGSHLSVYDLSAIDFRGLYEVALKSADARTAPFRSAGDSIAPAASIVSESAAPAKSDAGESATPSVPAAPTSGGASAAPPGSSADASAVPPASAAGVSAALSADSAAPSVAATAASAGAGTSRLWLRPARRFSDDPTYTSALLLTLPDGRIMACDSTKK